MTAFLLAVLCVFGLLGLSATAFGRRAASAPAIVLIVGATASLTYRSFNLPFADLTLIAGAAEMGLAALTFVCAAQFRISRLSAFPAALRLTLGGAPLFLLTCALAAYILLPQLDVASALLLAGALVLNGAAFDRRAVTNAPAPKDIKAAVRMESAAILALGAPIAILLASNASAAAVGEPATGPLMETSFAVLKGFAFGGVAGLLVAKLGNRLRGRAVLWTRLIDDKAASLTAAAGFILAQPLGADPIITALGVGLIWGEETRIEERKRFVMRRIYENAIGPIVYFSFGCLFAPRLLEADFLTIFFALCAVTILRAGMRLSILQTKNIAKESQVFLAWFGGAPGAASALFFIILLANPALTNQDGVLTVGAVAVTLGVFIARLSARPLTNHYLRRRAIAMRRGRFAA